MTDEQRDNLLLAISRAQNAGRCSYIGGCVIAQLADVVDPTGWTRRRLERSENANIGQLWQCVPAPHAYSQGRLTFVQQEWDRANLVDHVPCPATPEQAEAARAKMREFVLAA